MGTEARRKQANDYRQGVWLIVAPLIEEQLPPSAIAAELNRRGIPRLQTAAGWTTDAVCKVRAAMIGSFQDPGTVIPPMATDRTVKRQTC